MVVTQVVGTGTITAPINTTTYSGGSTTPTYSGSVPGETPTSTVPSNSVTATSGTVGTVRASTVNRAAALNAITTKAKAVLHLTTFRSPTGNIGCVMLDGAARCDISQRSWKAPPHPASCSHEVDFGQGLEVGGSGMGGFVCAGDTALDPGGTPLRYGDASVEGDFACTSTFTGMTCTNLNDGHGFFISRQSYRVF